MGRKILLITTDQQRFDTLGCNGGVYSRTPVIDSLAAHGIRYERAQPQSVVCMPSRSTILTGQHPSTHGVWMNGVPLPADAPSIVEELKAAGYATALIGKSHFEPYMDPFGVFAENRMAPAEEFTEDDVWFDGSRGPHRGFDHMEMATHSPAGTLHYSRWLIFNHPEALGGFFPVLDGNLEVSAATGGDTDAVQVAINPIDKEWYHTDWVADRTIDWLSARDQGEDWFCWMSFPDPHHPWDPPASELGRVAWQDIDLPAGYVEDAAAREQIIADKPRHWMDWYTGALVSNFEAPQDWVPATLQADQLREITAKNAVEVELIDDAVGRVMAAIEAMGCADDVDIIFTTDHGELGGDFGLLFKGVDDDDASARGFERSLTEWDSSLFGVEVHLRTITRDGFVCTIYGPGTSHDGTEGELYDLVHDPLQQVNLFNDPSRASLRDDLIDDLRRSQPPQATPLATLVAPV